MRELFVRAHVAWFGVSRRLFGQPGASGQGTVEYVGLILLVALLMVGMELAQTIVDKIREAVKQVSFK